MEKIKIFIGPPGSGKSTAINLIASGKKIIMMHISSGSIKDALFWKNLNEDTELVIFDSVPVECVWELTRKVSARCLLVQKVGQNPQILKTPRIIIETEFLHFNRKISATFLERFEIVNFPQV